MSVWPGLPVTHPSLSGSEGTLVSVAVHVDPRYLEALLEALAQVDFPVNPQIYHDAALEYRYPDGRIDRQPVTVVEFPAYESRVAEVRRVLAAYSFPPDCLHVADMLADMQSGFAVEPAPDGAPYVGRALLRRAPAQTPAAH